MKISPSSTNFDYQHAGSRQSGSFFFPRNIPRLNQSRSFHLSNKPHPIPDLPVLNALQKKTSSLLLPNLKKATLICIQHNVESQLSLYENIIMLGVPPKNIWASGKWYSDNPPVVKQVVNMGINYVESQPPPNIAQYREYTRRKMKKMWEIYQADVKDRDIETLIVIDEGGRLIESMPYEMRLIYNVAGVEQTRGGLFNSNLHKVPFPVIAVASAAAKIELESSLIAETLLKKISTLIQQDSNLKSSTVFGVVGNGAIGSSVVKYLLDKGYYVIIYDENEATFKGIMGDRLFRVPDIQSVVLNAGVIIGCTGKDIMKGIDILESVAMNKTFISCTSEDKEFLSLLEKIAKKSRKSHDPFSDVMYTINNSISLRIVKGGFPINFDGSPVSVPTEDIQLTRGLIFGGLLQALTVAKKPIGNGLTVNTPLLLSLDPYLQRYVVNVWKDYQPKERYSEEQLNQFQGIEWIKKSSGGVYQENLLLKQAFKMDPVSEDDNNKNFKLRR